MAVHGQSEIPDDRIAETKIFYKFMGKPIAENLVITNITAFQNDEVI